jgi:NADH-quinone oxidoreductase subunit M
VLGVSFLFSAYSLLAMYRNVFWGPAARGQVFSDLSWMEVACILPLVMLLLTTGIYPKPFLDLVRPTVLTLLSLVQS